MTERVATIEDGSGYIDAMDEILALIKGRTPIIWVLTHEENRFIEDFKKRISDPLKKQMWVWSGYQGLTEFSKQMSVGKAETPDEKNTHVAQKALERIVTMGKGKEGERLGRCFLMRDMHTVLGEDVVRQMRDIYEHLIGWGKTLIIISPILAHGVGGVKPGIPSTLEKQVSVVHYELPNSDNIKTRIETILEDMKGGAQVREKEIKLDYTNEEIDLFTKALSGLTLPEIDSALSTSMTHLGGLNVKKLINEKRQIISRSDILEFVDTNVGLEHIGGLDQFKKYIQRYIDAQTEEAKAFGVEPLKGIVLVGIAGAGKSLSAKALGNLYKQPLVRLDIGKIMGSLVGQSESRAREAVKTLKSMAPCVCLIDEIEKMLSGSKSSGLTDGGTFSRVFGTFLYAMEEELEGVTFIATSNNISVLPPELIRRFNDVFFVDLPGPDERWEIFDIHLKKKGRDIKKFEKHKQDLLNASLNYTGAEIEKSIKAAIAAAFHAKRKDVNYKDIVRALEETKPIAVVQKDTIKKIRDKARGNYRYASSWAENENKTRKVSMKGGKKLDINKALEDLPEMIKTKKEKNKAEVSERKNRFADIAAEAD